MLEFKSPYFLLILLAIPLHIYYRRRVKPATMLFTQVDIAKNLTESFRVKLRKIFNYIEYGGLACLVIALARPRWGKSIEEIVTHGVDIVLALDISGSMRAVDFPPHDRIWLAKKVAKDFILGRPYDRIGLVVFARKAFTQCPLTLDHNILIELLDRVYIGMIEDGTAIGMGLVTALNRLKDSQAKSKVIILLTDGRNNAGKIDPITAAKFAHELGVKVYTIGAGKRGESLYPFETPFGIQYAKVKGVDLNEPELKEIAKITGGLYFRAETKEALEKVYKTIDKLEKVEFKKHTYKLYKELFMPVLITGLLLMSLVIISRFAWLKFP